ncbi:MAG: hypothetical protein GXY57_03210 [Erysipelotrichaceae bacterium]|jgi:hypothetical protein|nr:hypothetical protein [Bacilli bacterium]NLV29147.1 hypothetical protein [Erysipelotrichaceae bacterium]HPY79826.1 hypothetical protein [Bacilli bacterium]HQA55738.1 hypothetical protein [Bacilli bacterium]
MLLITTLMKKIPEDVAIWKIDSSREFFLQIFEKFKPYYLEGMKEFAEVRANFAKN